MDELPLVNEIRQARRQHDTVAGAQEHLQLLEANRMSLAVIEREATRPGAATTRRLPGDSALRAVAERFPQLADLATPGRADTPEQRLFERRSRLDTVCNALRPMAAQERLHSNHLHELRHEQHSLLKQPQYAEQLAVVGAIGTQRDAVYEQLSPRLARLAAVSPSRTVIEAFATQLGGTRHAQPDRHGVAAWRAATIATSLLGVLAATLAETGFELALPKPASLTETPEPADSERLNAATVLQLDEVADLGDALTEHAAALQAEVDSLQEELRQLNQQLQDHLG